MLDLRPSKTPQLQADAPAPRLAYANSYLVFQHRLHIDDYSVALVPDSTRKYGVLKLDIVVENSYNGEEPITAGYDIYDPKGKLLDYGSREIMWRAARATRCTSSGSSTTPTPISGTTSGSRSTR